MKVKWLFLFLMMILPLLLWAGIARAQEEVPAAYSGKVNPFPWGDASAQQAGMGLYRQSCLGCHGVKGDNQAMANFSANDYPQRLEQRPDFYFWVLSEGRMNKGMPGFKSALSEEQRWQVLSYLHSLGSPASSGTSSPSMEAPAGKAEATLQLTVPQQAQSGKPLVLKATLQDSGGQPVTSTPVKFFLKVDFFTAGLMEIGEAVTDGQGIAVLEYTPWLDGKVEVVARYGDNESVSTITLAASPRSRYQSEAGLRLPAPGPDILIGPRTALELPEMGQAPATAFRLPGGYLSWLLLFAGIVAFVWSTYFRVIFQVFRIPIASEIKDIDTRLVPLACLAYVLFVGILLVMMLLTGPYSHLHLVR